MSVSWELVFSVLFSPFSLQKRQPGETAEGLQLAVSLKAALVPLPLTRSPGTPTSVFSLTKSGR